MDVLTHPAIDLGVIIEYIHDRHFFLRADIGDCIIPFGGISYMEVDGPRRPETAHNLWLDFGIGVRM